MLRLLPRSVANKTPIRHDFSLLWVSVDVFPVAVNKPCLPTTRLLNQTEMSRATLQSRIDAWKAEHAASGFADLTQNILCCAAADVRQIVLSVFMEVRSSFLMQYPCEEKLQEHLTKIFETLYNAVNKIYCNAPCCVFSLVPFALESLDFLDAFVEAWKACERRKAFQLYYMWRAYAEEATRNCKEGCIEPCIEPCTEPQKRQRKARKPRLSEHEVKCEYVKQRKRGCGC